MAKASWCNVSPMSGNGNGTINVSAGAHTGRSARSTTVTVQNQRGTKPSKSIAISQAGASTQTTMDSTKPDVPGSGGTVTINGTSNSSKLGWELMYEIDGGIQNDVMDLFGVTCTVKVNNIAVTNWTPISGDPGASARYNFVSTLVMPVSPLPFDLTMIFQIKDDVSKYTECRFTWKAGTSDLSLSKSSLSLVNGGTAQSVNVTSNDNWTVS